MDWYIVHQVSQVHTRLITERLGIDPAEAPLTFPQYGNVGPAAIPITLASRRGSDRSRRPRAVHGHRIGAEHELHRNRLVTARAHRGSPASPDARATLATLGDRSDVVAPVDVPSHDGGTHRWHVLDTGAPRSRSVDAHVLCVHGNPTWGYAWALVPARLHGDLPRDRRRSARHGLQRAHRPPRATSTASGPRRRRRRARHDPAHRPSCSPRTTGAGRSRWAGRCRTREQVAGHDPVQHRHRVPEAASLPASSASPRRAAPRFRVSADADLRRGNRVAVRSPDLEDRPRRPSGRRTEPPAPGGDRRLRRRHSAACRAPVRSGDRRGGRSVSRREGRPCCWHGERRTRCSTTTSPPTSPRGSPTSTLHRFDRRTTW